MFPCWYALLQVRRRRKREEDEMGDDEDESRLAAFQAAQVTTLDATCFALVQVLLDIGSE